MGKKPRIIDAEALIDFFRSSEGAGALNHFHLNFIKIKKVIDAQPTADAIPVDWLEEMLDKTAEENNTELNNAIFYVLVAWEKEKTRRAENNG